MKPICEVCRKVFFGARLERMSEWHKFYCPLSEGHDGPVPSFCCFKNEEAEE
jgi:hypothetical protein